MSWHTRKEWSRRADGSCRINGDHSLATRKIGHIERDKVDLAVEQRCLSACKVSFGSYHFVGAADDTESPATANGVERATAVARLSRHRLTVTYCARDCASLR